MQQDWNGAIRSETKPTSVMMFSENQLLPISALQHLIFCERQCALIHVEQLWAENRLTVEGQHLHQKVHDEGSEKKLNIRITRTLNLRSLTHGLIGQADVVEFHDNGTIIPVEYKRGQPKKDDSDRIQICAQAICLEEMLDAKIEVGYLFYGKRKRRTEVKIDHQLRLLTAQKTQRLHQMIDNRETPPANRQPKCDNCSLVDLCLPDAMRLKTGASAFMDRQLSQIGESDGPQTDDDFEFIL